MKILKSDIHLPIEWIFWTAALVGIFYIQPHEAQHWSLCPLYNLGWQKWCLGCGLGRSIALLIHGDIQASFQMHWLGIPTLLVIVYRWVELSIIELYKFKKHIKFNQNGL